MPAVMDDLHEDHVHVAEMLDLLEQQIGIVAAGENGDFELLHDIMVYMTHFPDNVHHPKEDRLYAELRAVHPDRATGMRRIAEEHRELEEQSVSLLRRLEEAAAGDADSLREVVAAASRYADLLRKHMRWEEADLFRRLDKLAAEGHDLVDKAVVINQRDPLFGSKVEESFKVLYRCITRDS